MKPDEKESGIDLQQSQCRITGPQNERGLLAGTFLCFISGVYGILAAVTILAELKYDTFIVYAVLLLISGAIWGWLYVIQGSHLILWGCLFAVTAGTIFWNQAFLLEIVRQIIRGDLTPLLTMSEDVETVICSFVMSWGALCLYELTFHTRSGFFPVAVFAAVIGGQIYLGFAVSYYEICLLTFYLLSAEVLHHKKRLEQKAKKGVFALKSGGGDGIAAVEVCTALLLVAAYFVVTSSLRDHLYQIPLNIEAAVSQRLPQLFWQDPNEAVINRGELRGQNTQRVRVEMSEQPNGSILVKSFVGSGYLGDEWEEADESEYLAQEYMMNPSARETGNLYEEAFYDAASSLFQAISLDVRYSIITEDLTGDRVYRPYFATKTGEVGTEHSFDAYYVSSIMLMMEQRDNDLTVGTLPVGPYAQYVQEEYTKLPYGLERLKALCASHPAEGTEAITSQILELLWDHASYNLEPDPIPYGEDVAEYFLFERKEGYCQHFATAAVLMYRMYGIPARYVSGFVAPITSFEEGDNGWQAVLYGGQAHAWAEIYQSGLGWIPVETTPPGSIEGINDRSYEADPSLVISADDLESETESAQESEAETPAPTQPVTEAVPSSASEPAAPSDPETGGIAGQTSVLKVLSWIGGIVGSLLAASAVLGGSVYAAKERRRRLLQKQKNASATQMLESVMGMLHLRGLLRAYQGDEEDMALVLAEAVPQISERDAKLFLAAVERETFGNTPISHQERENARFVKEKTAELVYPQLGWWKRLYFRYGKVYG